MLTLLNHLFAPFEHILAAIRGSISIDGNENMKVTQIQEQGSNEFSNIIKALNHCLPYR